MALEQTTAIGYAHWACYLAYGDGSGLSDADIRAADIFAAFIGGDVVGCDDETFFARPDAGADLYGDCVEYTALIEGD